jgi:hypothetical protein
MRIGNVKIAASVLALRSVTARSLATSSGLPEETVKSWLKARSRWFKKSQKSGKRRGRSRTVWQLRDEAVDTVRLQLREQWPSIAPKLVAELDETPDFDKLEPLIAAEDLIDVLALAPVDDRRDQDIDNADSWTRAVARRLSDWRRVGIQAPLRVRRRLRACEICLQSSFALDVRAAGVRLSAQGADVVAGADMLITLFRRLIPLDRLRSGRSMGEDIERYRQQAEDVTVVLLGLDGGGLADRMAAMAIIAFEQLRHEREGPGWQDRMRVFLKRTIEVLDQRVEALGDRSPLADGLRCLTLEERLPTASLQLLLRGLGEAPFLVDNDELRGWLRELRESRAWSSEYDRLAQEFLAHSRHMSPEQIGQDRWGNRLKAAPIHEGGSLIGRLASIQFAIFLQPSPPKMGAAGV